MARKMLVAIAGATSGLGRAVYMDMLADKDRFDVIPIPGPEHGIDFNEPNGVRRALRIIKQESLRIDPVKEKHRVLLNCVGINYIDWFKDLDFEKFDELMRVNVRSHIELVNMLLFQPDGSWFSDDLGGHGTVCEIVSNAAHVPMTNSSFYNASKAAQHMAVLAMARELRKSHGLNVFGIAPNKLNGTGMSRYIEGKVPELRGWTPEEAERYQLNALPAGAETDPEVLAEFITFLLSHPSRHRYLTNTIIPYGA